MRDVGINVVVRARGRLEIEGLRADDDVSELVVLVLVLVFARAQSLPKRHYPLKKLLQFAVAR